MTPDDHSIPPSDGDDAAERRGRFDLGTDEGLETYLFDLARRRPIPESLHYPETDEEYDQMIEDAWASGYIPAEEVEAWLRSLETDIPLPRPRAR